MWLRLHGCAPDPRHRTNLVGVRFLLRPAWLALIVTVVAFVVACFAILAPWQFGREAQRDADQHRIDVASGIPPVPLAQLTPVVTAVEWRQVTVIGTYLDADEALVRLRSFDGGPAYEVMTPLRTSDGTIVAVDRGYVRSDSGSVVPPFVAAPAGQVTIVARLRVNETDPDHRPALTQAGHLQIYVADSRSLATATGLTVEGGYLLLADGQPGTLTAVPVEPEAAASAAPFTNFSYALQWITFGAIAVFALVYFVRLEMLQRSEGRTERSPLRRALAGDDDDHQAEVPEPVRRGERALKDRYGG